MTIFQKLRRAHVCANWGRQLQKKHDFVCFRSTADSLYLCEAYLLCPTVRMKPWGWDKHTHVAWKKHLELRVVIYVCVSSREFICKGGQKAFFFLSLFKLQRSMASSLCVKEWLNGWREEDKRECLFFIPPASCLLAPHGAPEPKERWLLGYRWAVGIQERRQVHHCEWQPGENEIERGERRRKKRNGVEWSWCTGGRGEHKGERKRRDRSVERQRRGGLICHCQHCKVWDWLMGGRGWGCLCCWGKSRRWGGGVTRQPGVERRNWREAEGGEMKESVASWGLCHLEYLRD